MNLDWEGLSVAFAARSRQMNHFLDLETGEVHAHLSGAPELRAALELERGGRYLRIPKSTPEVDAVRARAFASRIGRESLRKRALEALEADGVNAFREVLMASAEDEAAWFVFRDRRVRAELREWLKGKNVPLEP